MFVYELSGCGFESSCKKHDVYTENINKIALINDDDKRIVSSDKITSYPYGYKGKIV